MNLEYCYPEQLMNSPRACSCTPTTDESLNRGLQIDCSYNKFNISYLKSNLPYMTLLFDLSYNKLKEIPKLYSDQLKVLNLMHNSFTKVGAKIFEDTPNLVKLYLSWNNIQLIDVKAFESLAKLELLDLSHNSLHDVEPKIFAPLLSLKSLNLRMNPLLAETKHVQRMDFYDYFGLQEAVLTSLNLEYCGLNHITFKENTTLEELFLRGNPLVRVPRLPANLKSLDISGTLLADLLEGDVSGHKALQVLNIDDMPLLEYVAENSLSKMESLEQLTFRHCTNLKQFDGYAFGHKPIETPSKLVVLSFFGSALTTLNGTDMMRMTFQDLQQLNLYGLPLNCDCHLTWLKDLIILANGVCMQPARLRGRYVNATATSEFDCRIWPDYIYRLIIFGLLLVCCGCLYIIVVRLIKPNGNVKLRNKVGVGSPYAPVTIEPNKQEYVNF